MKGKIAFWLCMFCLCLLPVFGAEFEQSNARTLFTELGNNISIPHTAISSNTYEDTANINITIYAPNKNIVVKNDSMEKIKKGRFIYEFRPNVSGQFLYEVRIDNQGGGNDDLDTGAFTVEPKEVERVLSIGFTIFLIGILLAFLGIYMGNALFSLAAGVWFILTSVTGLATIEGTGFVTTAFFTIVGLALTFHAILQLNAEYKGER